MQNNKFLKVHSLLRMFAAVLVIAVFISMFVAKQIVHSDFDNVFFDIGSGAFFGDGPYKGNVFAFIGYLLVFIGGLAGLAFVFIDEIIGKDLTKKLSFAVGGLMVVGAIAILLVAPIFIGINELSSDFTTGAGPIVFGILALLAAAANIAAPILEDKGL